jgi:hypothetical protein
LLGLGLRWQRDPGRRFKRLDRAHGFCKHKVRGLGLHLALLSLRGQSGLLTGLQSQAFFNAFQLRQGFHIKPFSAIDSVDCAVTTM